ncbi:MAG: hypothetical protein KF871_10070 [Hydrogenophaga sp.]|uniref:DUF6152 family protein n=1 Tax=Hydrogenophaga sp. TaxID=1904254 RepID=UPI001D471FC7|nr:DUF6152 family protein [Hydrogenophaga sp.]MBX3610232.1 hypothetical protein [Hydrogenophaga sp.]
MDRREFLILGSMPLAGVAGPAMAHHGWSGFDQSRPIYLAGKVVEVAWRNPHAELIVEVPASLAVPADLAQRPLPNQTASVNGVDLLRRAVVPTRKDARWEIELAPIFRMNQWQVPEPKVGDPVAMVGFTFKDEQGEAVMRVEYLFIGDKAYGLRSSPA